MVCPVCSATLLIVTRMSSYNRCKSTHAAATTSEPRLMPRPSIVTTNRQGEEGVVSTAVVVCRKIRTLVPNCHSPLLSGEHRSSQFFYMTTCSPASSCIALMASHRLILCMKKIKGSKDDSQQQRTRDHDNASECHTLRSLLKYGIISAGMCKWLALPLHLTLRTVRIFTTPVATPVHIIYYTRICIRTHIRINTRRW